LTAPTVYAYQWYRTPSGGTPVAVPGATTIAYRCSPLDAGAVLTCRVTGTNSAGSVTVASLPSPAIVTASGYAAAVASIPSLALWVPLDEASGTVATDHSSNANHGTYSASGVTYSVVDPGASTLVDNKSVILGTASTVSIPNHASLRLACTSAAAWTLSMRILVPPSNNGPTGNPGYPLLLAMGDNGAATGFQLFYAPSFQTIGVHIAGAVAAAVPVNTLTTAMNMITVTWNGSVLSYYQNGKSIGSNSLSTTASITDTTNPFVIGPNVTCDQVIIANSCLSAATVGNLYFDYATGGIPAFVVGTAPGGVKGVAQTTQLTAAGVTPITFSHTGTLPAGMSLTSAGVYSGTPTVVGTDQFAFVATNSVGSATAQQNIVIAATAGAALGFASAIVWQDDYIREHVDSTINPGNSAVAAIINRDAADMQAAKITWVRYWPSIADAGHLAGIFQIFKNHGISMIYCYNFGTDASSDAQCVTQLQSIVPAISAVGAHVYEIGNEMNLVGSPWTANNPIGNYCSRLKAVYPVIKGLDPQAYVISGGISYNQSYTADGSTTSDYWFDQFCSTANGMWAFCDGIGIHPYSDSNQGGVTGALADTRNAINSASGGANFANKPLCITELGWWYNGYSPGQQHGLTSPASDAGRDSVWAAAMNLIKANGINGGTFPVCYYSWTDGGGTDQWGYGVVAYTGANASGRAYSELYTTMQNYSVS
jgi:hypothetical protein